jgi:hypothetical protein
MWKEKWVFCVIPLKKRFRIQLTPLTLSVLREGGGGLQVGPDGIVSRHTNDKV